MKKHPLLYPLVALILIGFCGSIATAAEKPIKVYIFAGQSNMGGGINFGHTHKNHPAVAWMDSDENDVIYFWNRGKQKTDEWERLNYKSHREGHWEQVTAHRIWKHWQEKDPEQEIAIITVTVGATSLYSYWQAGGRGNREGLMDWIKINKQGKGNKMLEETIKIALGQLKEQGKPYEVEAFIWYQGEGDSLRLWGAKMYERYLRDLIDGWEDLDPARFKQDKSLYAGSLREWTGSPDLDVVIVRVSEHIQGASSWGPREEWEPALMEVRRAQEAYADSHDNAVWISVDDLPLSDAFHFDDAEYITIGERAGEALIKLNQQ